MSASGARDNRATDDPGATSRAPGGDRAAEGFEHLQAAALEMISAARAFLDVIEEVVADRSTMDAVLEAVGSVAEGVGRAARTTVDGDPAPTSHGETPGGPVEHIRVS